MLSQIHQMPPLTVLVDHYVRQDHVAASFENSVTTRQVRLLQVLPPPAPLSNVESGVESRRATSPIPVFFKDPRDEPSAQPSPVPVDVPAPAPGLLHRRGDLFLFSQSQSLHL